MKTRNLLALITFLLICSIPASAAITFTTRKGGHQNAGAGATSAVTINSQVAANMDVCSVLWCADNTCATDTSSYSVSVADTAGSTYTQDKRVDSAVVKSVSIVVFHAKIASSTNNTITATITPSTGVNFAAIQCGEFAGQNVVPVDQSGTSDTGNISSPVSVTAGGATVQAAELVYAAGETGSFGPTLSAGTGYTLLNSTANNYRDEYQIVSSIATYTATFTFTGSVPTRAVLVTYKAATYVPMSGGVQPGP